MSPGEDPGGSWTLDRVGFTLFVAYLVLAFTTAYPNQFALPKLLGLAVYTAFAAALWIVAVARRRARALPRLLALTGAASAAWWILTTVTARHVPTALFGMRGRYNGSATMLAGLALFVFIATTRNATREVEWRIGAVGVVLAIAAGYAVVQGLGRDPIDWGEDRPASTVGHPVVLGAALAMVLPFAVAFALDARSRGRRRMWSAIALLQTLALILTLARGPWIAAVCGLAVLAVPAIRERRSLARRIAPLVACGLLLVVAVLAISKPARTNVLGRLSTLPSPSRDSSLAHRLHFYRAAIGIVRDQPLLGVGWESFGLVYPAYRSPSEPSIEPDLVPTMVHSGPLQTAVSGGLPAVALQIVFLAGVAWRVNRRRSAEASPRGRLLGAAFLGSMTAYVVQDLSGWPHLVLGPLSLAVWGLGVAWSLEPSRRPLIAGRGALLFLAAAILAGGVGLANDAWRRIRAERMIFEAQSLDVGGSWAPVEKRLRAAIDLSPDRAWVRDAAARLYARRAAAAGDRVAYERAAELSRQASAANPFDPYLRLRRAEVDVLAARHGLAAVSDEGRDAVAAAKSMAADSAVVRRVESSLSRVTGDSRIAWIEPQSSAGFGPPGSLVVAGSAPNALARTRVFLHWRNLTAGSGWITETYAPAPNGEGAWFNAIPRARPGDRYEVYATAETWSYGPCAYEGNGSITLCSPIALLGPDTAGVAPAGSVIVAGSVPRDSGAELLLHWRNLTRGSGWTTRPFRSSQGASFPEDAPGNWYAVIPGSSSAESYQVYLSSPSAASEPCTYPADGAQAYCSPIAWIQPRSSAGFGPAGSLVVAGFAARRDRPIFLHWRNATRRSAWVTEAYASVPDARGIWFNAIPSPELADRYEVYATSPTTASPRCIYSGNGSRNVCP